MLLDNSLQQTIFRLKIATQVLPLTYWKFRRTSAIERPNAKRELQETNIRLGHSTVNINNLQGSFFLGRYVTIMRSSDLFALLESLDCDFKGDTCDWEAQGRWTLSKGVP